MKTLLILALTLTAAPAFAKGGVPSTAKLLFQTSGSNGAYDTGLNADQLLDVAVRRAEANIQAIIKGEMSASSSGFTGMFAGASGDEERKPINVEYECQALYRVWSQGTVQSKSFQKGDTIFSGTMTRTDANISVNVYCQPRDFRQKVAISAMQACEKESKPECMSKEYMDAFSKIQQTTYNDINKP